MDIISEAEKLQKALREIESLLSTSDGEAAENLRRLRRFFSLALDQVLDGCCNQLIWRA